MSDDLASLSDAAAAVSGLATLAFGASGPVVLGSFAFQDFEVPESIQVPVRQAVGVHRLIGGERVFDAMGPDYGDIAWTGVMLGAFAEDRVQTLKALVDEGQAVALTWGTWSFTVLPHQLSLREAYQRIFYAIRCAVIRDDSAAPEETAIDLGTSMLADMGSALGAGGATLGGTLGTAQGTLRGLAPIAPGSAGVGTALATVSAAQAVVGVAQDSSSSAISSVGVRAAGLSTPVASLADLSTVANQTGALAQAAAAGTYLGRMAANLNANL
jgi:hypothetical protein